LTPLVVDSAPATPVAFRTIGQLAERCGQYCWLENRLFALTGMWASAPDGDGDGDSGEGVGRSIESEVRVFCSEASSWHGFMAGQWRDRLPVRAGVDAGALIVPAPGPVGEALELLGAETDVLGALGGLVGQILPALLAAYEEHLARASRVSEAPVRAVLGLAQPRAQLEIERGRELLRRGTSGSGEEGGPSGGGGKKAADVAARLRQVWGVGSTIFPAARAS